MAWIESHQTLRNHPKTLRLASLLGVSIPAVLGHLHCLWWWILDYAQNGDLSRYDADELAMAAMWAGDPKAFLQAMMKAGFLDGEPGHLDAHDWNDYAGKLVRKREENRVRMCRARAAHVQRTCDATQPNSTIPNTTETPPIVPPKGDGQQVVEEPKPDWQELAAYVRQNRPRWSLTPATAQQIADAAHEFTPALVLLAVREAVTQDKDGWAYPVAILDRWRRSAITTPEQAETDLQAWRQRSRQNQKARAPNFQVPVPASRKYSDLIDRPREDDSG